MQNNFTMPVYILSAASRRFAAWSATIHLGAILSLLAANFNWPWKILLLVLVVQSYRSIKDKYYDFTGPGSVTGIYCSENDEWQLAMANGEVQKASLLSPYFVHPQLVVLAFKTGATRWHRRYVILVPDAVDPDSLRRLRVRLRLPQNTD